MNDVPSRDWLGLRIRNTENVQDKVVGISLRRRNQFNPVVVWGVVRKVVQSNARFALADRLEVHFDHVTMPAGNGGVKTKGRSLDAISAIKKSIVRFKAVMNCLAYALFIAMVRLNEDPKYRLYKDGKCLKKPVEDFSRLPVFIFPMVEVFTNFNSFKKIYRIT